ncbi:MAG: hypothetical protein JNM56_10245 [Planctomycetia bacterium]|nr:hypothetical protein [Planctomycetia bacterium]
MARQHHYLFAYMALPDFAFRDASRFLMPGLGQALVAAIWEFAGENSDERLPADGLEMSVEPLSSGLSAAVVQLPAPAEAPEAYFAAIVPDRDGNTHYFTLERSVSLDGSEEIPTVLGGVDLRNGFSHSNYGEGPPPERRAFVAALERLLHRPTV